VSPPKDEVTSLGAVGESGQIGAAAFPTTHWSVVLKAQSPTPAAQEALEKLCRSYTRAWSLVPREFSSQNLTLAAKIFFERNGES
jgi:hypothetical protein